MDEEESRGLTEVMVIAEGETFSLFRFELLDREPPLMYNYRDRERRRVEREREMGLRIGGTEELYMKCVNRRDFEPDLEVHRSEICF